MQSQTMAALKNIYVGVRHGESEGNVMGIIVSSAEDGTTGYGLSTRGREQAEKVMHIYIYIWVLST